MMKEERKMCVFVGGGGWEGSFLCGVWTTRMDTNSSVSAQASCDWAKSLYVVGHRSATEVCFVGPRLSIHDCVLLKLSRVQHQRVQMDLVHQLKKNLRMCSHTKKSAPRPQIKVQDEQASNWIEMNVIATIVQKYGSEARSWLYSVWDFGMN